MEMEVHQQDAQGMAEGNPGYTTAVRPAIYFVSSAYF
jgi:hypothetical protein